MKKSIYILGLVTVLILVTAFVVTKNASPMPGDHTGAVGIVYGSNFSYSLTAPSGWVLDNEAGKGEGLMAVFYKKGNDWQTADARMYTNTIVKSSTKSTFAAAVDADIKNFKSAYPELVISDAPDLNTDDPSGTKARIKYQFHDQLKRYQAVAYIDSPHVVIVVVLDTKNMAAFNSSLNYFEKLVNSYFYVTDNVSSSTINSINRTSR